MKSISEDLSNKIKTLLQTPANNADPKMSITVVRAKDTVMDNTYWTTEVIRTKEGLGDLSVAARRLKPYGGPDSLYNIYVDNGVVKTAIRAYPDYQKDGWQDQFELGAGTACAICFDGYWELYKKKWQMVTSEKPWIFWVTGGVLYTQYWDDVTTKLELATGVNRVKAIRGWKNAIFQEIDQGVMVSYIKTDGKIYYRNYCWQSDDSFAWGNERQLTDFDSTYSTHNMFITTDYRMGIIAENTAGEISWIITTRAWAGMASPMENIATSVQDITIDIIPIEYHEGYTDEHISTSISDIELNVCPFDFDISQVIITLAKRISDHQIKLVFSHSLLNVEQSTNYFAIVNKTIDYLEYGDSDKEIIINTIESLPSVGVYTVNYTGEIIKVSITACCNPRLPSFTVDAVGDPPEHNIYINTSIVIPTFIVTQVYYSSVSSPIENLNTSITDITLVVTQVGNNPL